MWAALEKENHSVARYLAQVKYFQGVQPREMFSSSNGETVNSVVLKGSEDPSGSRILSSSTRRPHLRHSFLPAVELMYAVSLPLIPLRSCPGQDFQPSLPRDSTR